MKFINIIQPTVAAALSFHPNAGFTVSDPSDLYKILKTEPVDAEAMLFAELGCEMIPMVRDLIQLTSDIISNHLKPEVPRDFFTRIGVNRSTEAWIEKVFFTFNVAHDPENFKLVKEGIKEGTVADRVASLREMTTTGYNKALADLKTLL